MAPKTSIGRSYKPVMFNFLFDFFISFLLPYGPAVVREPFSTSGVDESNESLTFASGKFKKLVERVEEGSEALLQLPEAVFFDNEGILYVTSESGALLSLTNFQEDANDPVTITADATVIIEPMVGRFLGGEFTSDGTLYLANPVLGLIRVQNPKDPNNRQVEIVASSVTLGDGTVSPILYADDVSIGPNTGHVYFTDASDIPPIQIGENEYDVVYASVLDGLRGKASGRLLRYKPETGEVDILADGLYFANGVTVNMDESSILVSTSLGPYVWKYTLDQGAVTSMEIIVRDPPGFFDGLGCDKDPSSNLCYVAVFSTVPLTVTLLYLPPPIISAFLRTLAMLLPSSLSPAPQGYGGIVEFSSVDGSVQRILQDPSGSDITQVTSCTVNNETLYIGSLGVDFVGLYDLS